jgi:hypothetical protein
VGLALSLTKAKEMLTSSFLISRPHRRSNSDSLLNLPASPIWRTYVTAFWVVIS